LRAALLRRPQVLHFAVHVVSPRGRPEEAALALSLTADNVPELLTREAIAEYRVPGSLVILSGCSSQQGETLPSAGLIGLSRAWLLAGASAVIVSAWPTPDDSGRFFSSFYTHFQPATPTSGSLGKRAALALQQAQLEMRRSNGYGSSPASWAAYSVISKE
jgi:CHAT domain-containing protein